MEEKRAKCGPCFPGAAIILYQGSKPQIPTHAFGLRMGYFYGPKVEWGISTNARKDGRQGDDPGQKQLSHIEMKRHERSEWCERVGPKRGL
ncbi:MAG: hypothetical protein BWY82_00936 [Verrucomicrobia bacterium ADurb.Bin474]|nr:MAG: hypothetical protein BWY82_00936 [Verrucomicrobia bacterium ADurb.Bin474]